MPSNLLFCTRCRHLITPEEAEAEDFASIGGLPFCKPCLEGEDPEVKRKVLDSRTTRIMRKQEADKHLEVALAPSQVYPPPNIPRPPKRPTSPDIKALREEIRNDLMQEWNQDEDSKAKIKIPPRKIAPDPALTGQVKKPEEADKPKLERSLHKNTKLILGGVLVAGLLMIFILSEIFKDSPDPKLSQTKTEQPFNKMPEVMASPIPVPITTPDKPNEPDAKAPPVNTQPAPADDVAKVEILVSLVGENPNLADAANAIERLVPFTKSSEEAARVAASDWTTRYESRIDALAREAARETAARGEEAARQQLYTTAIQLLNQAGNELPASSPWVRNSGKQRLEALASEYAKERQQALAKKLAEVDTLLQAGKRVEARAKVDALAAHAEPTFQAAANDWIQRVQKAEDEATRAVRERELKAKEAWTAFFPAYDAAIASGNSSKAITLCKPAPDSLLLTGGVENPSEVLSGFAAEAAQLEQLYKTVLAGAQKIADEPNGVGKQVYKLALIQGGVMEGRITGIEKNRMIVLTLNGGPGAEAQAKTDVSKLAPEALESLLQQAKEADQAAVRPVLWSFQLANKRNGAAPEVWLTDKYSSMGGTLPVHWKRRFQLENEKQLRAELDEQLSKLAKTADGGNVDELRTALSDAKPLLDRTLSVQTPQDKNMLAEYTRKAGTLKLKRFVFQNGQAPAVDYLGGQFDQINSYYKNTEKTNAATSSGIKFGSVNGVQRLLVRFDGLSAALGMGKLRKATFELYQVSAVNPAIVQGVAGPTIALFKLKKNWVPGTGTWSNADQRKKLAWQRAGAGGQDDSEGLPIAKLTLDNGTNCWRSWDITPYVQELLKGKGENPGMLMRIVNEEPRFDVRFYPDTDMDARKEPALRPRLVVEYDATE